MRNQTSPQPSPFVRDRVAIVGDIHIDHDHGLGSTLFDEIDVSEIDLLIVAGDLTDGRFVPICKALALLQEHVELSKVHVIPGDKDYWNGILSDNYLSIPVIEAGAKFAQKSVINHRGRRYLCCTLWTDFEPPGITLDESLYAARLLYPELKTMITVGDGPERWTMPEDLVALHLNHLRWLKSELAKPFKGETIVVTHHAPTLRALPRYAPLPFLDTSDLNEFARQFAPFKWVYAHTGVRQEFTQDGVSYRNVSWQTEDDRDKEFE